ncbi:MAG: AraC family transcriptional regulator [Firmicutes bacterium]|nr:AraC family transcriptional regulator [Bacillota bacterium]
MDTTANLNAAMRYIEQRLFDVIDFTEVARIACCSEYQFRRMFSYLAGMTLNEYIRKRRLSIAASLLQTSEEKIIDISLRCGYESPDAFSKAFQAMYCVSPSVLRKSSDTLKVFPPLFFHLTLKGGIEMEYRIVERGEFYLMGKIGHIPLIYHGANPHTANVWKQLKQEDLLVLMEYSAVEPKGIVTVHGQTIEGIKSVINEGDEILYCVGVIMEKPMPDRFKGRFDVLPFEASSWHVVSAVDNVYPANSNILDTKEAYAKTSEWLPTSEYEETGAPIITWYESYDFSKPNKKSEVWTPVRKRVI